MIKFETAISYYKEKITNTFRKTIVIKSSFLLVYLDYKIVYKRFLNL